jgi:hypothetical protein
MNMSVAHMQVESQTRKNYVHAEKSEPVPLSASNLGSMKYKASVLKQIT